MADCEVMEKKEINISFCADMLLLHEKEIKCNHCALVRRRCSLAWGVISVHFSQSKTYHCRATLWRWEWQTNAKAEALQEWSLWSNSPVGQKSYNHRKDLIPMGTRVCKHSCLQKIFTMHRWRPGSDLGRVITTAVSQRSFIDERKWELQKW